VKARRSRSFPSTDKVKGGGITHLVALLNADGLPEIPKNLLMVPIVVRPRDSVPKEYILNNIEENMKLNQELVLRKEVSVQ